MDKYENMKRPELAALCRKHGLSDEGSATVLRKRIREARDAAAARKAAEAQAEEVTDEVATEPEPEATGDPGNDDEAQDDEVKDSGTFEVAMAFGGDMYFDDEAWDAANRQMVAKQAADAGHRTTGEVRRSSVEGNTIVYVVPVE